jgi:hypothetical protein
VRSGTVDVRIDRDGAGFVVRRLDEEDAPVMLRAPSEAGALAWLHDRNGRYEDAGKAVRLRVREG